MTDASSRHCPDPHPADRAVMAGRAVTTAPAGSRPPSAAIHDLRAAAPGELDVVYAVARVISGSTTWTKRVLPAVMLSAYRGWPNRPPETRPRVWMLMMLAASLEEVGAASIPTELTEPESEAEPTDAAEGLSFLALRHAMRGMALQDRVVLALSDIASLSYAEVGKVLELGREEVRRRLFSARARLQRRMSVVSASLARGS